MRFPDSAGKRTRCLLYSLVLACHALPAGELVPDPEEFASAQAWFDAHFCSSRKVCPWSFQLGGASSRHLLEGWKWEHSSRALDMLRTEHTWRATDPATGLAVCCAVVLYRDFPVLDWTLSFRNMGATDTPVLAEIQALDAALERGAADDGEFLLHHHVGSPCQPNDFQPLETLLRPNVAKRIGAAGGRPSNSDLPFFNLEWEGQGLIVVVGWPGQWAAEFQRNGGHRLGVRAGQEAVHLRLRPGEEIRSPRIVLQFWRGDRIRAQNLWRRWMLAHNTPRPDGKSIPAQFGSTCGNLTDAAREMANLAGWHAQGIRLDYWAMDAGWYVHPGKWFLTGTWEVDRRRFPRGLREISDCARIHGARSVVWFEPERVTPGSWLYQQHPDWLLGCVQEDGQTPQLGKVSSRLLNLGRPEARRWITDHISRTIAEEGIGVYRQDFNIDPLAYWRAADTAERQGATENAYVVGYLAFWDELLHRHPGLWIDTCASGGRRNDLETLRRSVPLLRSDYFRTPVAQQCHTYGLALWVPIFGTGTGPASPYMVRSSFCPLFRIGMDRWRPDGDYGELRKMVSQFRQVAPCLTGDFYPLTGYSLQETSWMAWQYDRPGTGEGVIQAFRRAANTQSGMRFRLRGLAPEALYQVTDLDTAEPSQKTGAELMDPGLQVELPTRPAAALIVYRREG